MLDLEFIYDLDIINKMISEAALSEHKEKSWKTNNWAFLKYVEWICAEISLRKVYTEQQAGK